MNISESYLLLVYILSSINVTIAEIGSNVKTKNRNNGNDALSGDFRKFLQDMESRVFKEKPKDLKKESAKKFQQITKMSHLNVTKHSNIFNSQKAALRDVLMLKLVSYYEDKYKLANQESTTIPMTHPPTTTTSSITTRLYQITSNQRFRTRPKENDRQDTAIINDVLNNIDGESGDVVVM